MSRLRKYRRGSNAQKSISIFCSIADSSDYSISISADSPCETSDTHPRVYPS